MTSYVQELRSLGVIPHQVTLAAFVAENGGEEEEEEDHLPTKKSRKAKARISSCNLEADITTIFYSVTPIQEIYHAIKKLPRKCYQRS